MIFLTVHGKKYFDEITVENAGKNMNCIGIVGVGVMGRLVGAKLLENNFQVFGYDISPGRSEQAAGIGVSMVDRLADIAARANRIILFLPGPAEIRECVAGPDGLLAHAGKTSIIIDMSTSSPQTTADLAEAAEKAGVSYLDAPVLGRPATIGKWALPVGGNLAAIAECRDIFGPVAAQVIPMGPSGAGHKVKLLNQLMFGAINAMTAEMMAVSEAVGVPPAKLYETITASQAGTVSNLFKELGRRVGQESYDEPTFTVRLLNKDVRLGIEMADAAGAPLILGRAIDFLNQASLAQGFGEQDTSVMWKNVKNFWK